MKKLEFSVTINAPKEKVWQSLWEDANYRDWTSAFMEGSYASSDWKEGSKILFLTPEGDGMHSIIARKIPNEYMSFEHIGTVKNGKEQPLSKEDKAWSGAFENYTLVSNGAQTTLLVEVDSSGAEWEQMLLDAFPRALDRVKALSEQ